LSTDNGKVDYAELLEDAEDDTREERVYRMWINSLGSETFVTSLFEDRGDGLVAFLNYLFCCCSAIENRGSLSLLLIMKVMF
jgi:hypothetical protein